MNQKALTGEADCGGIVSFNCYAGEPVSGLADGCPLTARAADVSLTLGNFMRAQLYAAMATLRIGMDILFEKEQVALETLFGHGGLFKTKGVGQRLMAGALGVPVAVLKTAGEGGPWGMALLAAYSQERTPGQTLGDFLQTAVFAQAEGERMEPDSADAAGFNTFMARYKACLPAERAAAAAVKG